MYRDAWRFGQPELAQALEAREIAQAITQACEDDFEFHFLCAIIIYPCLGRHGKFTMDHIHPKIRNFFNQPTD